ncbi:unnamed protein product [Owenia fusiformis]|uniref:Uncharacterized protein n=1 Tax=Owenia fusiformis TaxID=6347 RepID=A0A8J1XSJ7_OWEFU|nr:unnamed protein product [Owenia fusiformis]
MHTKCVYLVALALIIYSSIYMYILKRINCNKQMRKETLKSSLPWDMGNRKTIVTKEGTNERQETKAVTQEGTDVTHERLDVTKEVSYMLQGLDVAQKELDGTKKEYITVSQEDTIATTEVSKPTAVRYKPSLPPVLSICEISPDTMGEHNHRNITDLETNTTLIMYNRVPKCGSTTMDYFLKHLSKKNIFFYKRSTEYNHWRLDTQKLEKFIKSIKDKVHRMYPCDKFVYDRHIHYIDFTMFGIGQPLYFNIIRDPVERARSHYYHNRLKKDTKRMRQYSAFQKNQTFEDCISESLENMRDLGLCDANPMFYVEWFCGQDSRCLTDKDFAMTTAKKHIDEHVLVGLTEEFTYTLEALEKLLPEFFAGFSEIQAGLVINLNTGLNKLKNETVSPDFVDSMKTKMKYSYEIYGYVKQKFHLTLQRLNITKSRT